jgi:cytochrome c oxidase subunit 3
MSSSDQHHVQGLKHHFYDLNQQAIAARSGIWLFLISELMLFGGIFAAFALYKAENPVGFALASNELDLKWGAINTVVLLLSSLTVVLGHHYAQQGNNKALKTCLYLTIVLGLMFLGIKGIEYHAKWAHHLVPNSSFAWHEADPQGARMFFTFYFIMTGTHAAHMIAGMGVMIGVLILAHRGYYTKQFNTQVETSGLYWHFVDIVWIFLFPLLYLLGRHG